MFNNGLSPLTKMPFSTIVTPFVCRKLKEYLHLSVRWMFLLLFRSMNKRKTGVFYISRIYVNALQDGSRVKKASLFPDWLLCFSSRCYIAFLVNSITRSCAIALASSADASVIYVAVRAANVLFSLTFRFHGSRFVEILAVELRCRPERSRCQAALQECRQTDR